MAKPYSADDMLQDNSAVQFANAGFGLTVKKTGRVFAVGIESATSQD